MLDTVEKFLNEFAGALAGGTFVKLTLGNYKGPDEHLQKIQVRLVQTRKGTRLFFVYRSASRDTVKNYDLVDGHEIVGKLLGKEFFGGHLFTTENDLQLDIGKNGKSRLNLAKATFRLTPPLKHNRDKKAQIDLNRFYLKALGVTDDTGRVRDKQQDKWRQINKFVEILASLVDRSELKEERELRIVDMGSGKGYLTFAAYDYFRYRRGVDVHVTGVEARADLVELCNGIARASEFGRLEFVEGTIDSSDVAGVDILIALHACNTATDDAIYKGIKAGAELIVVAPCCHQELRPQIRPPAMFRDILKHGVMLERVAETLTDGLRSMLLEREGYSTKMVEFVSVEHTPKNNMIAGTKLVRPRDATAIAQEITAIKDFYGIRELRLEKLLDRTPEEHHAVQRKNA